VVRDLARKQKQSDRRKRYLRRSQASALLWDHQRIDGFNDAIVRVGPLFRR
jgi:hypothetical protein